MFAIWMDWLFKTSMITAWCTFLSAPVNAAVEGRSLRSKPRSSYRFWLLLVFGMKGYQVLPRNILNWKFAMRKSSCLIVICDASGGRVVRLAFVRRITYRQAHGYS